RRVLLGGAFLSVTQERHDIRVENGLLGARAADEFPRAPTAYATRTPHPRRIDDPKSASMPCEFGIDRITRRAWHLAHEHALFLQEPIEQRRLADIRAPDDGHA